MADEILCLIPARGGSKGVKRKNIALLGGKPLIAWTIEIASSCPVIDSVMVSTEDTEIAQLSRDCGAEVPYLRPPELAGDDTSMIEVVLDALKWLQSNRGHQPEYVLTLQPTSPFRTKGDIEGAVRLAREKSADFVVSVCSSRDHPYWCLRMDSDSRLDKFCEVDHEYACRQSLPPAYSPNGAIYLARRAALLERRSFCADGCFGYAMPAERSLDINTSWDFYLAQLILQNQRCS